EGLGEGLRRDGGQAARAGDVADAAAGCRRRLPRAHRARAEGAGRQYPACPGKARPVESRRRSGRSTDMCVRRGERSGRRVLQAVRHEAGRGTTRMMPRVISSVRATRSVFVTLAVLVLTLVSAAAQMPDPRQMSGIPRPDPQLQNGVVTVR